MSSSNADDPYDGPDVIIVESYDMDIPDDEPIDIHSEMSIYRFHHYARREEPVQQENVAEIPPQQAPGGVYADVSYHEVNLNLRESPLMFQDNDDIVIGNNDLTPSPVNEETPPSIESVIIVPSTSQNPPPVLRLECTTFPVKDEEKAKEAEVKTCQCNCHNEPPKTTKKRPLSDDEDEDDGKLCPICFDVWTTCGDHRVCAAKCGHLFGHNCLVRWLENERTCPTCKQNIQKTDLRFIYTKKIVALDTTFLNALQLQLSNEQLEKNKLQMDLIQVMQREELSRQEISNLKKQISVLQTASQSAAIPSQSNKEVKFNRLTTVEICTDGGSRVMDYFKHSNVLCVAASSPNPLFSGFGIKKVSISNPRNSIFIPLHSNSIRDMAFHPEAEILLTASTDKLIRLTETNNNKPVHTIKCTVPIWSCCWDKTNPIYFYAGEQTGDVCKYDMRKSNEKLSVLKVNGDFSPVVQLATTGWNQDVNTPKNSVIVCKLNSCSVFVDSTSTNSQNQAGPSTANHYPLGLTGPFVSMRYCTETNHLLVSSRPNMQYPFAKHTISTLSATTYGGGAGNLINCNVVHTFRGAHAQKLLSRSCQMRVNTEMFVAAHNESQNGIELFSVATGSRKTLIPIASPILDLCHVPLNTGNLLCALNGKKVDIVKLEFS